MANTTTTQQIESTSKPGAIEVVETVEEMSSSSFSDNIREEQFDPIMMESIEELANTGTHNFHKSSIKYLQHDNL